MITSGSVDGKDSAFKLFGGYMFNRHFGVEGAYVDLGEVSYSGSFFGSPVTGGTVETTGFNVAALGSYPVTEEFSVFGKIGLFIWEAEASDTTGGVPFSAKTDGTDLSFGLGVNYNFTRNLGVRGVGTVQSGRRRCRPDLHRHRLEVLGRQPKPPVLADLSY